MGYGARDGAARRDEQRRIYAGELLFLQREIKLQMERVFGEAGKSMGRKSSSPSSSQQADEGCPNFTWMGWPCHAKIARDTRLQDLLSAAEGLVLWLTAVGGKSKSDARKSSDFCHGAGQWTR